MAQLIKNIVVRVKFIAIKIVQAKLLVLPKLIEYSPSRFYTYGPVTFFRTCNELLRHWRIGGQVCVQADSTSH